MIYVRKARGRFTQNDSVCRNGHPRTPANTIQYRNHPRRCRVCMVAAQKKYERHRVPRRRGLPIPLRPPTTRELLLRDATDPRIATLLQEL